MKKTVGLLALCLLQAILLGQVKLKQEPLILKGQFKGCGEKHLFLYFKDPHNQSIFDSIALDADGRFYLKTYKVKFPQRASIQKNNIQINDFMIAPGYDLTVTASGNDFKTVNTSKKISGTGAESNLYKCMLDSIIFSRNDTTKWVLLNKQDILDYAKKYRLLKDSVAKVVFSKNAGADKYFAYFKTLVEADNTFEQLGLLCSYVNINAWRFSYDEAVNFVKLSFDSSFTNEIFKKENLISGYYKYSFITSTWLSYLINLDSKKDSSVKNTIAYRLKKITTSYKGTMKDFSLFDRMNIGIEICATEEELNNKTELFQPYIASLEDSYLTKILRETIHEKRKKLHVLAEGKPAPQFVLPNNKGTAYSLKTFKGKLVYIDLWASWCGPCRAETPSLKKLYNKYKNNSNIVFISIAVLDSKKEWQKALKEDKPGWLQLYDEGNIVADAYAANLIPKFVLIDRLGNIISADAPRPGETENLEKLITDALSK